MTNSPQIQQLKLADLSSSTLYVIAEKLEATYLGWLWLGNSNKVRQNDSLYSPAGDAASPWLPKGSWTEASVSCNVSCPLGCLDIFRLFQLTVPKSSAPSKRASQNMQCLLKIIIIVFL